MQGSTRRRHRAVQSRFVYLRALEYKTLAMLYCKGFTMRSVQLGFPCISSMHIPAFTDAARIRFEYGCVPPPCFLSRCASQFFSSYCVTAFNLMNLPQGLHITWCRSTDSMKGSETKKVFLSFLLRGQR